MKQAFQIEVDIDENSPKPIPIVRVSYEEEEINFACLAIATQTLMTLLAKESPLGFEKTLEMLNQGVMGMREEKLE